MHWRESVEHVSTELCLLQVLLSLAQPQRKKQVKGCENKPEMYRDRKPSIVQQEEEERKKSMQLK